MKRMIAVLGCSLFGACGSASSARRVISGQPKAIAPARPKAEPTHLCLTKVQVVYHPDLLLPEQWEGARRMAEDAVKQAMEWVNSEPSVRTVGHCLYPSVEVELLLQLNWSEPQQRAELFCVGFHYFRSEGQGLKKWTSAICGGELSLSTIANRLQETAQAILGRDADGLLLGANDTPILH